MTVDGIHFPIDEPRPFSSSYKSHKHGAAGLVYEFGLFTHKAKLAWLNGPFPAAKNDKTVFRQGLKPAIEQKQTERNNAFRVIGDDGYIAKDLLKTISLRNELDPKDVAYFKDRSLARHEKFNSYTKNGFEILRNKFRQDRGDNPNREHPRHKAVVEMICVTVQYELDLGIKKLFDPYP